MGMNRRVFISAPRDVRLDAAQIRVKEAILEAVRESNLLPQVFLAQGGGIGLPRGQGWAIDRVEPIMRRCVGAVLIGLPFWQTVRDDHRATSLPSDYCAFEGAIALACRLPILAIAMGIEGRGVFDEHAPLHAVASPSGDNPAWVQGEAFRTAFAQWIDAIGQRRDVFLAYCSKSEAVAQSLIKLIGELGASVLPWQSDFVVGDSILDAIEDARSRCSCGVFLFSEDDPLQAPPGQSVPRDNVVFEAGYFMSAKGQEQCLIIRNGEPRLPADIAGMIYADLPRGAPVDSIRSRLVSFLAHRLGGPACPTILPNRKPRIRPSRGAKDQA